MAHDKKALQRWRSAASRMAPDRQRPMGGQVLEQAVKSLANTHPQYVAFG